MSLHPREEGAPPPCCLRLGVFWNVGLFVLKRGQSHPVPAGREGRMQRHRRQQCERFPSTRYLPDPLSSPHHCSTLKRTSWGGEGEHEANTLPGLAAQEAAQKVKVSDAGLNTHITDGVTEAPGIRKWPVIVRDTPLRPLQSQRKAGSDGERGRRGEGGEGASLNPQQRPRCPSPL